MKEGMDRRHFLRGLGVAGAALAAGTAKAENLPVHATEALKQQAQKPAEFPASTNQFVDLLVKVFAQSKPGGEEDKNLEDALSKAEIEYLNRFAVEQSIDPEMRTPATDGHAMFNAFARAAQIPQIDQRIMGNLLFNCNQLLVASAKDSLAYEQQHGHPMPHLNPNEREA